MSDRFLAFRMLGAFEWPPSPSDPNHAPPQSNPESQRKGAVEIFYVRLRGESVFRACVRWTPLERFARSSEGGGVDWVDSAEQDIPDVAGLNFNDESLANGFIAFIPNPAAKNFNGFRFQGGDYFEQFAVPGELQANPEGQPGAEREAHRLTARIPLVRISSGGSVLTGITIDARERDSRGQKYGRIRVTLALPVPLPPGSTPAVGNDAFAFAMLRTGSNLAMDVAAVHEAAGTTLGFDTLLFGPSGNDVKVRLPAGNEAQLGRFLFSGTESRARYRKVPNGLWTPAELKSLLSRIGLGCTNAAGALGLSTDTRSRLFPDSIGLWIDPPDARTTVPPFRILSRIPITGTSDVAEPGDDEDIWPRRSGIRIRRPSADGGWLDVGPSLTVMADLHADVRKVFDYGENGAAIGVADPPLFQFHARIAWSSEGSGILPVFFGDVAGRFNRAIEGALELEGAQPAMLLPRLELPSAAKTTTPACLRRLLPSAAIRHGSACLTTRDRRTWAWGYAPAGLLPGDTAVAGDAEPGLGKHAGNGIAAVLTFPLFLHGPQRQACVIHPPPAGLQALSIRLIPDPELDDPDREHTSLLASVAIEPSGSSGLFGSGSIGGLGFVGVSLAKEGSSGCALRAYRAGVNGDGMDLELQLRFDAHKLVPLGTDIPRGQRRVPGLIFDERTSPEANGEARFVLDARESLRVRGDRELKVQLRELVEHTDTVSGLVLLSEEPFAVRRAVIQPVESRGGDDGTVVARYSSYDRSWHTLARNDVYRYVLPPQAIGESMDKPGRLELQDGDGVGNDGLRRRAVEFRLTPPADLWVRPSDVSRRFLLAEWAAGELFVQQGGLGPGPSLAGLAAEFVYGISTSIDPLLEHGSSRRARVTEIEALVGRPVEWRRSEGETYGSVSGLEVRWEALGRAYGSRPERLEIWADDRHVSIPFATARFSSGARFVLRNTAFHRHPLVDQPGANPVRQDDSPASARFHPHGLSGGALWPTELQSVLDMLLREPVSSGGSIEQVALSPLGGDATQTACFAGNRVAIVTETRGGYVQRQKLEVIGRIGVLWHRAKHVIVYERSVNASAQFAPPSQDAARTKRPVLRKVEEYIEILQPERRYPDVGHADPGAHAFLAGVRFNSNIIPVDSGWAEKAGDAGYLIPLWNRFAAREKPQVYGRPDVAFLLRSEGGGDQTEGPQECLNPDNLYFFAANGPDLTDDTDRWPELVGIDTTSLPPPSHVWRRAEPSGGSRTSVEAEVEPVAAVPLGYGRFTWRLAPPPAKSQVNAGRATTPVYASLETVTFVRGTGPDWSDVRFAATLEAAARFRSNWKRKKASPFEGVWGPGKPPAKGKEEFLNLADALETLAQLPRPPIEGAPDVPEEKQPRYDDAIRQLRDALGRIDGRFSNAKDEATALKNATLADGLGVSDGRAAIRSPCARLKDDFIAGLGARKLVVKQHLDAWHAEIDRKLEASSDLAQRFGDEEFLRDYLEQQVVSLVEPGFRIANSEVGKLQRGIEAARAILADADRAIQDRIDRLVGELRTIRASVEPARPWSEKRIARLQHQIDVVFAKAVERLHAIEAEFQRRLAIELDETSQRVADVAMQALSGVREIEALIREHEGRFHKVERSLRDLHDVLGSEEYEGARESLHRRLDEYAQGGPEQAQNAQRIQRWLNELHEHAGGVRTASADIVQGMKDLEGGIEQAVSQAREAVTESQRRIDWISDDVRRIAQDEGEDFKKSLLKSLQRWEVSIQALADRALEPLLSAISRAQTTLDWIIQDAEELILQARRELRLLLEESRGHIDRAAAELIHRVNDALGEISPHSLASAISSAILEQPDVEEVVRAAASAVLAAGDKIQAARGQLSGIAMAIERQIDQLEARAAGAIEGPLQKACEALHKEAEVVIEDLRKVALKAKERLLAELPDGLNEVLSDPAKYAALYQALTSAAEELRMACNGLAASVKGLEAWGDRVIEAIGDIDRGGMASVPNNILKAMAAFGSGPEMPNLDASRDRIAYYYGQARDIIETTPFEAWFAKLGDSLKAMGLALPCDRLLDRLLPVSNLHDYDIGRILEKFGGIELVRLLRGIKMPKGAGDRIRLSHGFDRKAYRAWVQIDIDLDLPSRSSLIAVGPFALDLMGARLVGVLRLEASQDTDCVEETGEATVTADFASMVSGQMMVTLRQVRLTYARDRGLEVHFDPSNIRLNPALRFIENTLKSLFPDEIGGMEVVRSNGVPVGLRHSYALPPLSLLFGTSGVQNIQISNQFELIAYPDFLISNRFALARPEQPFIFTIFIIGGTGWLTVDVEYRPFDGAGGLLVVVEAGAGGSASLGFSFAGVTGSVCITVSVLLRYRKLIGRQGGGGLGIAALVVIAGVVDVLRIARAMITVVLRLNYHDNGDIDAVGSFRVSIRISRFFRISASGQARYRLRGNGASSRQAAPAIAMADGAATAPHLLWEQSVQKAKHLLMVG